VGKEQTLQILHQYMLSPPCLTLPFYTKTQKASFSKVTSNFGCWVRDG